MDWVDEEVLRAGFSALERTLLSGNVHTFDGRQRRLYRRLQPRLLMLERRLRAAYRRRLARRPGFEEELATHLAVALVSRGYTTILEMMLIDMVGRDRVSRRVGALKGGAGGPAG